MTTDTATDARTVWQLARMADCSDPDTTTSPGAEWLRRVESAAAEIVEYNPDATADDVTDDIAEQADAAVPIYTHNRWQVFVDLCAYNEDPTDLGFDGSDMEQGAGICLYMIAERLLHALVTEMVEAADEEDDE